MPTASRKPAAPPERRTIDGLELDASIFDLAVGALRSEAERRRRAGVKISGELTSERRRTGGDVRAGALRVIEILAEADGLERAAADLTLAWDEAAGTARTPDPAELDLEASPPAADDADDPEVTELDDAPGPDAEDTLVAEARAALGLANEA